MAGVLLAIYVAAVVSQLDKVGAIAVPASQCADKVSCNLYSATICTDPQYFQWANENCASFCKRCAVPGAPAGEGKLMTQGPTCVDKMTNCADYGTKMCDDVRFYSWTNENCRAFCTKCTQTCEDKVPNCADYGDTLCTELSYYNWVEMNCPKFCARCTP